MAQKDESFAGLKLEKMWLANPETPNSAGSPDEHSQAARG